MSAPHSSPDASPTASARRWAGKVRVVEGHEAARAQEVVAAMHPIESPTMLNETSVARIASFRDGVDRLPWLIVGPLCHATAFHVCARGGVWCVVEGDRLVSKYVAISAEGAYVEWCLGPLRPDEVISQSGTRPASRWRRTLGFRRRLWRTIGQWSTWLTFGLLCAVGVADDVISDLLRRDAPLAGEPDVSIGWAQAALDLSLVVVGFLAFAWLATAWLKVRMSETSPTRHPRVLVIGLSPLDRFDQREFRQLKAADSKPNWWSTLCPGDLAAYADDEGGPIHPHAVSQLEAALRLSLPFLSADAKTMVELVKVVPGGRSEQVVDTILGKPYFPWLQNLRAIGAYSGAKRRVGHDAGFAVVGQSPVEHILVLASRQARDDYPLFAALLRSKFKECGWRTQVSRVDCEPDVDSFTQSTAALLQAVEQALTLEADMLEDDIVIDITSAARPFGLAAAVLTMNRDFAFSFVDRAGNVHEFDGGVALARG
jgi:hypothetical protein